MLLWFVTFFATHFPCWLIAVFVQSFRSYYSLHSFTHTATPTPRKSCHSFTHSVPLAAFHFQGLCLFPRYNLVLAPHVAFSVMRFSTPHITPYRSFRHNSTSFAHYFHPLPFQRNVRAKKCAKPAAGSTRPPRSALPVSGALAPLA